MTKIQKFISLIPFFVMCGCVVASWVDFILDDYIANTRHYATLVLVLLNGVLYFIRFRAGIWMTGAILLFGIAGLTSLTSGFGGLSIMGSPPMEGRSILILILYGVIDFGVFGHEFFKREVKNPKKSK